MRVYYAQIHDTVLASFGDLKTFPKQTFAILNITYAEYITNFRYIEIRYSVNIK